MPKRTLTLSFISTIILLLTAIPATGAQRRINTSIDTVATASPPPQQRPVRAVQQQPVPAPEDVLGFRPGADRKLASWASVVDYFQQLDKASDRVHFAELGRTTLNAPFVMATISSPENLARLTELKEIQRQLADPRVLQPGMDRRAAELIAKGKTVVLITCNVHSTEVGSYLSGMLIAHHLAASNDRQVEEILRNTIVLIVPSLNPDGVDIVKNWYDRTLGTPYEGTSPPELYHKYVGHDNNRDWYAFTQKETQITVDRIHNEWRPQIVHDIHQQGAYAARLFVPPYMKPVEPNVPQQIVDGYTQLGRAMANGMRGAGFKGITTDSSYDAWTPARAYSHYHGGVRILSETASARIATPLTVRPEELRAGEGYDPRKVSANFPELWSGGAWGLKDITNYMTTAAFTLLQHAAGNREEWLRRFYEIGKEAVRERKGGELHAFIIPPGETETGRADTESPRRKLLGILARGGVELDGTRQFVLDGKTYPSGTVIVRIAQPYGNFAKALLEVQRYPDLRDPSGKPIPPYDVTAHTLPLLMGVEVKAVYAPFKYTRLNARYNEGGGHAVVVSPRFAIYKSHVPSMDEGWTRWVIENSPEITKCCPSLEDKEARAGNLRAKYDTIIIPDQSAKAILEGHKPGAMPAEYTGGLGAGGVRSLREFVEGGGTLVCLNKASNFAIDQLKLPVRDVTLGLKQTEFYVPGSILRTEVDTKHPIASGMPKESVAWAEDSPVFEVSDPKEAARVSVIARYPENANPLLSGWLLGEEKLRGKAALVEVGLGQGRVVLFGFRPQYRGQSLATYPLLFNAILRSNASATSSSGSP